MEFGVRLRSQRDLRASADRWPSAGSRPSCPDLDSHAPAWATGAETAKVIVSDPSVPNGTIAVRNTVRRVPARVVPPAQAATRATIAVVTYRPVGEAARDHSGRVTAARGSASSTVPAE